MDQNQIEQSLRLKKLIKALNINQTVFAKSLGMTQPNISRMVSGEGKISFEVLNRITIAYKNVNVHWLLSGYGTMFFEAREDKSSEVNEPKIEVYTKGKGRLEELEDRVQRLEKIVGQLQKNIENQDHKEP